MTGQYTLLGVVLEQLDDANIVHTGGDFDIGNNGNNHLAGTIALGLGGNDTIDGLAGTNDFLQGNQGNDHIYGHGGADIIRGGSGNDHLEYFGTGSTVYGDRGDDYINAGLSSTDGMHGVTIYGGNGNPSDPLDGDDYIVGSDGADYIQGNGGNDWINGGAGDDTLRGGKGDDYLYGASGNDIIKGDLGNDEIEGHRGADVMTGGLGNDTFQFDQGGTSSTQIADLTSENLSTDALNITATNFGPGNLDQLDSITDLDLGLDGAHAVDKLSVDGWGDNGAGAFVHTVSGVAADNLAGVIAAAQANGLADAGDQAVLVHVESGLFANKSFMVIDTTTGDSDPDFLFQVTGVTGTFSTDDIIPGHGT
jgi:Ca2+-binding RTX toxin-like protein